MRARRVSPGRRSAVRVAIVTTLVAAAGLTAAGIVLDRQQRSGSISDVDAQLGALLSKVSHSQPAVNSEPALIADELGGNLGITLAGGQALSKSAAEKAPADKPSVVTAIWVVGSSGRVIGGTPLAPTAPTDIAAGSYPRDEQIDGRPYRLAAMDINGGRLVAATDVSAIAGGLPVITSVAIGAALLAGVFAITLIVGLRAVAPVERARRAQLDFTADASHELRTPLSVIEAEAALVLRDPGQDDAVAAISRIAGEGRRLRGIVDGLLWLARYDAEPAGPRPTVDDLSALAGEAVSRFAAVAARRSVSLRLERHGDGPWAVRAPDGWLDRMLGVLLDNACRVTPDGGEIVVRLRSEQGRVALSVDDSGPGIPDAEGARVLARFHRLDGTAGGSGLGLAIADAIVRASGGRWSIGTAPEGGAAVGASWPVAIVKQT